MPKSKIEYKPGKVKDPIKTAPPGGRQTPGEKAKKKQKPKDDQAANYWKT